MTLPLAGPLAATLCSLALGLGTPPTLEVIGRHATGRFDRAAAEVPAYHAASRRLFVVDAEQGIRMLDLADPTDPRPVGMIESDGVNGVAVYGDLVAFCRQPSDRRRRGEVVFLDPKGERLGAIEVGFGPDMLAFSPDGRRLLVANEGEPEPDGSFDPEGSISVIDLAEGPAGATVREAGFAAFDERREELRGEGAHLALVDVPFRIQAEPEYIAFSPDGATAFVTLQEVNAIAIVDVAKAEVRAVRGLGGKDFALPGAGLDANDRDAASRIAPQPVFGLYQPDSIACFVHAGTTYLVTANEGETRELGDFNEAVRVKQLKRTRGEGPALDPVAFPPETQAKLRSDEGIGRLFVSAVAGDDDGDGDYDRLFCFGARSFSIWSVDADDRIARVFDSGDAFERIVAERMPEAANADHAKSPSRDARSDRKGPEPEGLVVGEIDGRRLVFVGLERAGGVMCWDITDPSAPRFLDYANPRDPTVSLAAGPEGSVSPERLVAAGDLGPESMVFIPAAAAPGGRPLLVVANEVSGPGTGFAVGE